MRKSKLKNKLKQQIDEFAHSALTARHQDMCQKTLKPSHTLIHTPGL